MYPVCKRLTLHDGSKWHFIFSKLKTKNHTQKHEKSHLILEASWSRSLFGLKVLGSYWWGFLLKGKGGISQWEDLLRREIIRFAEQLLVKVRDTVNNYKGRVSNEVLGPLWLTTAAGEGYSSGSSFTSLTSAVLPFWSLSLSLEF